MIYINISIASLKWSDLICAVPLQPDPVETSHIDAWYMDDSEEDQRLPHRY